MSRTAGSPRTSGRSWFTASGLSDEDGCRSSFQLFGAGVDPVQDVAHTSDVFEVGPAAGPRPLGFLQAVHPSSHYRNLRRILGLNGLVSIDRQVPMRPQITGENVADPTV